MYGHSLPGSCTSWSSQGCNPDVSGLFRRLEGWRTSGVWVSLGTYATVRKRMDGLGRAECEWQQSGRQKHTADAAQTVLLLKEAQSRGICGGSGRRILECKTPVYPGCQRILTPDLSAQHLAHATFLANPNPPRNCPFTPSLRQSPSVWWLTSGALPGVGIWVLTLRLWKSRATGGSIPSSLRGWFSSLGCIPRFLLCCCLEIVLVCSVLALAQIAACFFKACKPRWQ